MKDSTKLKKRKSAEMENVLVFSEKSVVLRLVQYKTAGQVALTLTLILLRLIFRLQNPQFSCLHVQVFSKCSGKSAFFTNMPHSGCTQGIFRNSQLFVWLCFGKKTKYIWNTTEIFRQVRAVVNNCTLNRFA